ncbi:hypothetical protein DICA2_D16864 [Diutina catenulata]
MRPFWLFALGVLAVNGGLDDVVEPKKTTVDTTKRPDITSTVMETETAEPPEPTTTKEKTTEEEKTTEKEKTTVKEQETTEEEKTEEEDTPKDQITTTVTTSSKKDNGEILTTTVYPSSSKGPQVVTVFANPEEESSTTDEPSYITITGTRVSEVESVQTIVTEGDTTYPVTTINGRVITLVDVTVDSSRAAAGKTTGGVVSYVKTVIDGHTSHYATTILSTRTGKVTAHPYETLQAVTMTSDGNIIVVTKKTTVTPTNNWGTVWDSSVYILTRSDGSQETFVLSSTSSGIPTADGGNSSNAAGPGRVVPWHGVGGAVAAIVALALMV